MSLTRSELLARGYFNTDAYLDHDYAAGFVKFSEGLIEPPVGSIPDLVEFNIKHAERAMPYGKLN